MKPLATRSPGVDQRSGTVNDGNRSTCFPTLLLIIPLLLICSPARSAVAATITGKAVTFTLTSADMGLTSAQSHANWSGSSTFDGGDVSGTSLSLAEGTTTLTKTNLLFFTYSDNNANRKVTATYTLTNPTLVISGVPSTTTKVTITSVTSTSVSYSSSTRLYSGYASMTLDLSNATRSGTYKTTGTTITINVTII